MNRSPAGSEYRSALERLRAAGRVYPAYETAQELDLKRKIQLGRGDGFGCGDDDVATFDFNSNGGNQVRIGPGAKIKARIEAAIADSRCLGKCWRTCFAR